MGVDVAALGVGEVGWGDLVRVAIIVIRVAGGGGAVTRGRWGGGGGEVGLPDLV